MLARGYYVTVVDPDTKRRGFLLGPFGTHKEAKSNVSLGSELAYQHNANAPFYAYGTAYVKQDLPKNPAVFNRHDCPQCEDFIDA